jgi:hypothetical protein
MKGTEARGQETEAQESAAANEAIITASLNRDFVAHFVPNLSTNQHTPRDNP